jgi:hypothetical protein
VNTQRDSLSSTRIAELFRIADGARKDTSEDERRQAIRELICEFRRQTNELKRLLAERGDPSQGQIDSKEISRILSPLLVRGIKSWGLRIFAEPHPIRALEILLGVRERRGKRAKNADRDFQIAVDVVEEMTEKTSEKTWRKRMGLEKAAEAVALKYELEPERIQKIYKRHRVAARAEFALRHGG